MNPPITIPGFDYIELHGRWLIVSDSHRGEKCINLSKVVSLPIATMGTNSGRDDYLWALFACSSAITGNDGCAFLDSGHCTTIAMCDARAKPQSLIDVRDWLRGVIDGIDDSDSRIAQKDGRAWNEDSKPGSG